MASLTNAEKLARARAQLAKYKEQTKSKGKTKHKAVEINGEKYSSKELKDIAERTILSKERDHKSNVRENGELRTFEEMLKYAIAAGAGYGWIKNQTKLFTLIPLFYDKNVDLNNDVAISVVLYGIATRASMSLEWRKRVMALALQATSSAAQELGGSFDGLKDLTNKIDERIGFIKAAK